MTRAEPCAVIAMEVLIEQDMVAPVRILLKLLRAAVHWPAPSAVEKEDPRQAIRNLLGNLEEIHQFAGTRRAFDLEAIAVVRVEIQEPSDQAEIDGHPDGAPPVG